MRGVTDKGLEQALEIKKRLAKSYGMDRVGEEDYKRVLNKVNNVINELQQIDEETPH